MNIGVSNGSKFKILWIQNQIVNSLNNFCALETGEEPKQILLESKGNPSGFNH